jgi:hypothetical protein
MGYCICFGVVCPDRRTLSKQCINGDSILISNLPAISIDKSPLLISNTSITDEILPLWLKEFLKYLLQNWFVKSVMKNYDIYINTENVPGYVLWDFTDQPEDLFLRFPQVFQLFHQKTTNFFFPENPNGKIALFSKSPAFHFALIRKGLSKYSEQRKIRAAWEISNGTNGQQEFS